MPTYAILVNFTDQGFRNAKNIPLRARSFESAIQEAGGRTICHWWTMGPYDVIVIAELPDDETAARTVLATGMLGNIRSTTMRCFNQEEMERIVQDLP
jgi:uncharacterized protein with GYD domain